MVVVVVMMFQMRGSLKHPARLSERRNLRYKATNKAWRSWGQVALYYISFPQKVQHVTIMERRKSSEFLIFSVRVHDGYETKRNLVH